MSDNNELFFIALFFCLCCHTQALIYNDNQPKLQSDSVEPRCGLQFNFRLVLCESLQHLFPQQRETTQQENHLVLST